MQQTIQNMMKKIEGYEDERLLQLMSPTSHPETVDANAAWLVFRQRHYQPQYRYNYKRYYQLPYIAGQFEDKEIFIEHFTDSGFNIVQKCSADYDGGTMRQWLFNLSRKLFRRKIDESTELPEDADALLLNKIRVDVFEERDKLDRNEFLEKNIREVWEQVLMKYKPYQQEVILVYFEDFDMINKRQHFSDERQEEMDRKGIDQNARKKIIYRFKKDMKAAIVAAMKMNDE